MKNALFFTLLSLFSLFACVKYLPADQYIDAVMKDIKKRSKVIERGGFKISVVYQPWELFAARELSALDKNESMEYEKITNKYKNCFYFVLSVETLGNENLSGLLLQDGIGNYSKNLKQSTFSKNEDFFIFNKSDTLRLLNYQYERNWGLSNQDTFILMFNRAIDELKLKKYDLMIRNLHPKIGTIQIQLKNIINNTCKLKVKK